MNASDNITPASLHQFRKLWDHAIEPARTDDAEKRRLSRLLSAVLLVTSLLGLSIELEYYLRWRSFNVADVIAYSGIGAILLAYFINRLGYYRPAAYLSIAAAAITTYLSFLIAENLFENSTLLFYLILPILMADFFLGAAEYVVISSLILAAVLRLYFLGLDVIDIFFLLFTMAAILGIANFSRRRMEYERQTALREAEKKYRTLVEEIPAITYIDHIDTGRSLYVSPQIETILGVRQKDWIEGELEFWLKHVHPADRDAMLDQYTHAQKHGLPLDMEYRLIGDDGREIRVRDRATVEKDADGNPLFFHGVISNVTEIKLAELALKKSEARYRLLFESMLDGFALHEIICDENKIPLDYRFLEVNAAFETIVGKTTSEIVGKTVKEVWPDIDSHWIETYGRVALQGQSVRFENYSTPLHRYFEVVAFSPRPGQFATTFIDITERRQSEKVRDVLSQVGEAVHTSKDLKVMLESIHCSLGQLMDVSNIYVALRVSPENDLFTFPYHSDAHETFLEVEDLSGGLTAYVARTAKPILVDPKVHIRLIQEAQVQVRGFPARQWMGAPLKSRNGVIGVVALQSYDNASLYTESHLKILEVVSGQIALAIERKRAEEALLDSQSKLEALFSQSLDGFFFMMIDEPVCWNDTADKERLLDYIFEHQHVTKVNDAMLAQYAAELNQFIGMTPKDFSRHNLQGGRELWQMLFDAGHLHIETDERKLDGTQMWIEGDYVCLYDSDGKITGHFGIQREVTAQKHADKALRASEEQFRNIFEFSGIPIWVEDFTGAIQEFDRLNHQGITNFREYADQHPEFILQVARRIRVVDVNNTVLKSFGLDDKSSLLGSLADLYCEDGLLNFKEELLSFAEGKTYYEGETSSFTPDGQRHEELVIASVPDTQHMDRVLVTILDITERRQREREMEALATVSAALRHASRRAEMLPVILDQILLLLNAQGGAIVLRNPSTGEGVIEAGRGAWEFFSGMYVPASTGIFRQVMDTAEPFITKHLASQISGDAAQYVQLVLAEDIQSMAGIPLLTNTENLGVIYIGRKYPFTPLEIRMLTSIADMSANAIQRVSAHELAVRRAEELSIVNEIGRTLAETLDLEQIYDQLHRAVFHLLPDTSVLLISMYDSEKELIHCVFGLDQNERINPADLPPLPLRPLGTGTQSEVVLTGRPLIVSNLPEKVHEAPARVIPGRDPAIPQSALYVPMIARNSIIGILQVQSQTSGRYTDADAELLSVVANAAAGAIENARLFGEVHQRIDQLQALHDIDAAISSSHDLRITLDILLSNTISLLGVDAADVLQLNPYTYNIELTAGQGFKSSLREMEQLPFEQGFAGRVASKRDLVTITTFPAGDVHPSIAGFLNAEGFRIYIGVPLTAKGMLIGILEIYHRTPLEMNAYWLDFLKTLAGQAALAIDNTELFMRLQQSNTQLVLAYDATIEGWSRALDLRDKETEGHTQRVTDLTLQLARAMHVDEQELEHIRRGALLHDIGKMGVPDHILLKADTLSEEEWKVMRRHPQYAYDLLFPIRYLARSRDIPYSHHEHWDGNGYPRGLKGELIPLAARIFAVVDVWDAIRSDRPYRAAWSEEKAMDYIKGRAGTQFDPRAVEAFVRLMKK